MQFDMTNSIEKHVAITGMGLGRGVLALFKIADRLLGGHPKSILPLNAPWHEEPENTWISTLDIRLV